MTHPQILGPKKTGGEQTLDARGTKRPSRSRPERILYLFCNILPSLCNLPMSSEGFTDSSPPSDCGGKPSISDLGLFLGSRRQIPSRARSLLPLNTQKVYKNGSRSEYSDIPARLQEAVKEKLGPYGMMVGAYKYMH